jgi:hypothetical protein
MTTLMRCTTAHHQGDNFVAQGTILPAGHPQAIPEFFEVYEIEDPVDPDLDALRAKAEKAGIKVDKRWGADRLYEEIAAASKGAAATKG